MPFAVWIPYLSGDRWPGSNSSMTPMKITYNADEKTLEIKDNLKAPYLVLKFVMVINVFNALLFLYNSRDEPFGWFEAIWVGLIFLSVAVFLFLVFKKSTKEKIPLHEIIRLREKNFFAQHRYSLVLRDGKARDLGQIKSNADISDMKQLFSNLGIPMD